MFRMFKEAAVVSVAAVASCSSATRRRAEDGQRHQGPGFTITLKQNGSKVAKLKAGVQYRFVISDQSSIHDFHLSGPGIEQGHHRGRLHRRSRSSSSFKKGTYTFKCDPHASFMHGSFKVA
jgi:plastocyanin